jgi:hypothetical protein
MVRNLAHVVERENAKIGMFIPYTCGGRRSDPAVGIGTRGSHVPESLRPVLKINYFECVACKVQVHVK